MTGSVEQRPYRPVSLRIWRIYERFVRILMSFIFSVVLLFLAVLFVNYIVLSTPKDHAYRNLAPDVAICAEGLRKGWTVLAEAGREKLQAAEISDDDGWIDPSNDETDVARMIPNGRRHSAVRCSATSFPRRRQPENRSTIISAFSSSMKMASPMPSSRRM